jgi:hypothetical protein
MQIPATLLPAFAESFGGRPRLFRAPGRMNLIGERTDYTGGLSCSPPSIFQPEQQKNLWVRCTQNLYDILDWLRQKHPRLEIESCVGGGGRIDLGILRCAC